MRVRLGYKPYWFKSGPPADLARLRLRLRLERGIELVQPALVDRVAIRLDHLS